MSYTPDPLFRMQSLTTGSVWLTGVTLLLQRTQAALSGHTGWVGRGGQHMEKAGMQEWERAYSQLSPPSLMLQVAFTRLIQLLVYRFPNYQKTKWRMHRDSIAQTRFSGVLGWPPFLVVYNVQCYTWYLVCKGNYAFLRSKSAILTWPIITMYIELMDQPK